MSRGLITQIVFALTVVAFIIGVHQTMLYGFQKSYFIFMFSLAGFFGYQLLRGPVKKQADAPKKDSGNPKGKKKNRRKA
ncbi:hypothetical protein [Persicobacter diffluens]|uniref:Uncharacterized protein n=1 Tax=Persicobacter diffluens TaxID=981 RepID=A0AAN4VV89_9BACT|nr:hypothetical protein PEDI_02530 [Persicobacter diffluens]